jgi:hypothetical protein
LPGGANSEDPGNGFPHPLVSTSTDEKGARNDLPARHTPRPSVPGPAQAGVPTMTRELDSRSSDGIDVRLLWDPQDDGVSVVVNDSKTGNAFELPVPDSRQALEVFHHPYAYQTSVQATDTQRAANARGLSATTHPAQ